MLQVVNKWKDYQHVGYRDPLVLILPQFFFQILKIGFKVQPYNNQHKIHFTIQFVSMKKL